MHQAPRAVTTAPLPLRNTGLRSVAFGQPWFRVSRTAGKQNQVFNVAFLRHLMSKQHKDRGREGSGLKRWNARRTAPHPSQNLTSGLSPLICEMGAMCPEWSGSRNRMPWAHHQQSSLLRPTMGPRKPSPGVCLVFSGWGG